MLEPPPKRRTRDSQCPDRLVDRQQICRHRFDRITRVSLSHSSHACRVGRRQARRGLCRSVGCACSLIVYREGVVAYADPDRPVIRGAGSDGETRVSQPSERDLRAYLDSDPREVDDV